MRFDKCRPCFVFFKWVALAMLVLLSLCSCFSRGKNVDRTERFIQELSDKDPATRWNAATALAAMKDARSVDFLIAALKDDNFTVRSAAAGALGKIRDARAVESLSAALNDENFSVRKDAADALVSIGSPAAGTMINALKDNSRADGSRCGCAAWQSFRPPDLP